MKFIISFLILVISSPCFAFGPGIQAVLSSSSSAAPFCASCPDATGGADVLCEHCDGTADGLCGWTISETGGATGEVDLAASCDNSPALSCTNIDMTYCASFVKTNTTASANFAAYINSTETTQYVQFYFKLLAIQDNTDNMIYSVCSASGCSDSASSLNIAVQSVSGTKKFLIYYHESAGWRTDVGGTSIDLDTWYGIRLQIYKLNGSSLNDNIYWWVDYSNNGTWTDEVGATGKSLDRPFNAIRLGVQNTADTISYMITGLKVDNDTMPTACTR